MLPELTPDTIDEYATLLRAVVGVHRIVRNTGGQITLDIKPGGDVKVSFSAHYDTVKMGHQAPVVR